ncbi:MAG: hypothetical protein JSS02_21255 [Planctomycetes bacterium]|nr:hypothetical protein [Planctomycetota bacterium]
MTATQTTTANPFYAARIGRKAEQPEPYLDQPVYAKLPRVPRNASPVPHLTSLYHFSRAGEYGDRSYPGNCGGNLIKDLLRFYGAKSCYDPMTGSGTCRDVCRELGIYCWSSDLREGMDACDATRTPPDCFDFCWIHPPYWRQKIYSGNPLDLSQAPSVPAFLDRYKLLLANCAAALAPGGTLAVLMGDYNDREAGFVPLVYHTKRLAFELGLKQNGTDIIRFSHGASSSKKIYRSSFIPGLHDVCMLFAKS